MKEAKKQWTIILKKSKTFTFDADIYSEEEAKAIAKHLFELIEPKENIDLTIDTGGGFFKSIRLGAE